MSGGPFVLKSPRCLKLQEAKVEFHEIRYFLAVSELLNFTRAAEHCNVS